MNASHTDLLYNNQIFTATEGEETDLKTSLQPDQSYNFLQSYYMW